MDISDKIRRVRKEIQQAQSVMHLDELKCRKRVLRRLGFTNEADVVQMKARVACEISTGDELVLSELLFNGFFNDLTPEQCAACLSCFIFEEKTKEQAAVPEELARSFREIQAQARTIVKVSQENKLGINEDEYLATFKPELMAVVLAWSKGATFAQIWQVLAFQPWASGPVQC
jgi:ATP-dependent RNA helicase DOB1